MFLLGSKVLTALIKPSFQWTLSLNRYASVFKLASDVNDQSEVTFDEWSPNKGDHLPATVPAELVLLLSRVEEVRLRYSQHSTPDLVGNR